MVVAIFKLYSFSKKKSFVKIMQNIQISNLKYVKYVDFSLLNDGL